MRPFVEGARASIRVCVQWRKTMIQLYPDLLKTDFTQLEYYYINRTILYHTYIHTQTHTYVTYVRMYTHVQSNVNAQ